MIPYNLTQRYIHGSIGIPLEHLGFYRLAITPGVPGGISLGPIYDHTSECYIAQMRHLFSLGLGLR